MKRTARRLVALIGAAVLLVLALAAGPANALVGAMIIHGGKSSGFVTSSGRHAGWSLVLAGLLAAAAIAVVAGVALAVDRRSRRQLAVAEGSAGHADAMCNDVVCELHPSRPVTQERKAA